MNEKLRNEQFEKAIKIWYIVFGLLAKIGETFEIGKK